MLILNQKQVEKIIPLRKIKDVVDVVEKGFFEYGMGRVQMPPKNYLTSAQPAFLTGAASNP